MKYMFTPDMREGIISGIESELTEDFVQKVRGPTRQWIYLNDAIRVWPSEILEIKDGEFNPYDWNDYPAITPPENVLMRIDAGDAGKFCGYYRVFCDGPCWCHADGTIMPEALSRSVVRFRPWDDQEITSD